MISLPKLTKLISKNDFSDVKNVYTFIFKYEALDILKQIITLNTKFGTNFIHEIDSID